MLTQTTLLLSSLVLGAPPDPPPHAATAAPLRLTLEVAHDERGPTGRRTDMQAVLRLDLAALFRAPTLKVPDEEEIRRRACTRLSPGASLVQRRAFEARWQALACGVES